MIFTKILILGLRIFKSQNLLFFLKIRNFGFVEEYLWESDNLLIKRKKKDSKSPPKRTLNLKKCNSLFSRELFSRRHWAHTRISSTFYRRERYNSYYQQKWYISANSSSSIKWKMWKVLQLKVEMLGRKKGPGILLYSRVKTEALKNTKREKKKM